MHPIQVRYLQGNRSLGNRFYTVAVELATQESRKPLQSNGPHRFPDECSQPILELSMSESIPISHGEKSLFAQVFLNVKLALCSLEAMIGHDKQQVLAAEVSKDHSQCFVEHFIIGNGLRMKSYNFLPAHMLNSVCSCKDNEEEIPGLLHKEAQQSDALTGHL